MRRFGWCACLIAWRQCRSCTSNLFANRTVGFSSVVMERRSGVSVGPTVTAAPVKSSAEQVARIMTIMEAPSMPGAKGGGQVAF